MGVKLIKSQYFLWGFPKAMDNALGFKKANSA